MEAGPWRNRKQRHSQNVLYAGDFSKQITFVQPDFESSAWDGTVLERAMETGLALSHTNHYLGDENTREDNV